jgi:von Willebrand factor type A domain
MGLEQRLSSVALFLWALAVTTGSGCGSMKPEGLDGPSGNGSSSGSSSSGGGSGSGSSGGDDTDSGPSFGDDSGSTIAPPLADAGCATGMAQAKRQPVYLEFVLDASLSMNQQNKWTAVVPALKSIFTQMQAAADTGVGAGIVVFSDSNDSTKGQGPYPSTSDVPIAYVDATHANALSTRISGMPANGTPTHAALTGGYTALESFTAQSPLQATGKKVLVLITDGVPSDDCSTLLTLGQYSSNMCIALAGQELTKAAPQGPIQTFVIGVGQFSSGVAGGIDPGFLGNLAQAGGTGTPGCNPGETANLAKVCYFEIDPSAATSAADLQMKFETALNAIRGQVVSCTFPLQASSLGTVDPTHVNVEVNGKTILQDPTNGWTYDNPVTPKEIILHGTACSSAEGTITAKVSIVLGCVTQMIPH